jgi:hypothetical protein
MGKSLPKDFLAPDLVRHIRRQRVMIALVIALKQFFATYYGADIHSIRLLSLWPFGDAVA